MTEHHLKCMPEYWDAVERGEKTFEARYNDRNFHSGDTLRLYRFNPADHPPGYFEADDNKDGFPQLVFTVGTMLLGPMYGITEGWAVLSLTAQDV